MIVFLSQDRSTNTHEKLIGRDDICRIRCHSYAWALSQEQLPPATYVFTDRERMDLWELRVLGALYRHLQQAGPGYRVANDPARMMNRRSLLRALYAEGVNDFNAYSPTERIDPGRFPVFIRREHDHGKPLTDLLQGPRELQQALRALQAQGEPEDGLLVTEYRAQPVAGNLFRKLSSYRVGDRIFFYNTVHEQHWTVKYGALNSGTDALYAEEQDMQRGNAYREIMEKAFSIAHIDYGRADFGLVDGKVQIYEINSNPMIAPPRQHPHPTRNENQNLGWENYRLAVNALDTSDPRSPRAPPFVHQGFKRRKRKISKLRLQHSYRILR